MKLFKRIRCLFGHHEPWVDPQEPSPVLSTSTGSYIPSSGVATSVITFNIRPFNARYQICRHCHQVYVKTEIDTTCLVHAGNVPGYNEWMNWKHLQDAEKRLHEENPTLKELWENYEMTKKLYQEQNSGSIKLNP